MYLGRRTQGQIAWHVSAKHKSPSIVSKFGILSEFKIFIKHILLNIKHNKHNIYLTTKDINTIIQSTYITSIYITHRYSLAQPESLIRRDEYHRLNHERMAQVHQR